MKVARSPANKGTVFWCCQSWTLNCCQVSVDFEYNGIFINHASVNPAPVQAVQALQGCTKMFHASAQGSDIDLQFVVDDSLNELGIDWVQIDASRVNQVAINLLTNAVSQVSNVVFKTLWLFYTDRDVFC